MLPLRWAGRAGRRNRTGGPRRGAGHVHAVVLPLHPLPAWPYHQEIKNHSSCSGRSPVKKAVLNARRSGTQCAKKLRSLHLQRWTDTPPTSCRQRPRAAPPEARRRHPLGTLHRVLLERANLGYTRLENRSTQRSEGPRNGLKTRVCNSTFPSDSVAPVKTSEGKSGRTDLHFAVRNREHDRTRHLIVELKRPSVSATQEELGQVTRYGGTIAGNQAGQVLGSGVSAFR